MNEKEIVMRISNMRTKVEALNRFLESIGEWGYAEITKEITKEMNELIEGLTQNAREGL